ncbi:hypothetical protein GCM10025777_13560 [Membranihabitans marinus]
MNLFNEIKIPSNLPPSLFKCRVVYSNKIETIEFIPYEIRTIHSFECVEDKGIDYRFKRCDRSALNTLKASSHCDEIIIIREGLVTDSSYANLAFYDGDHWYTPDSPLLPGTCRARLLNEKTIKSTRIRVEDLKKYKEFKLINAMMDWEESPVYNIDKIEISRFTQ